MNMTTIVQTMPNPRRLNKVPDIGHVRRLKCRTSLISFLLLAFLNIQCKSVNKQPTYIDLGGLANNNVKIVLSQFKLTDQFTWENKDIDSIITDKKIVIWPKKYKQSFIASLTFYNSQNKIVGDSEEFIFSNDGLIIKKKKDVKVLASKKLVRFATEGGENELFKNKDFLEAYKYAEPDDFNDKLKNGYDLNIKDKEFAVKWAAHEQDIIANVGKYNTYYYTLYRLFNKSSALSDATLQKCYDTLDNNLKNTNEAKFIYNYLKNSKLSYVGKKIITFNICDKRNKALVFNNTLGNKYYLLDFWASWCIPCRKQMQQLKVIHENIDTTKFQFISLSADARSDKWLEATNSESLAWPSYVQPNDPKQNLFFLFSLGYIPQNILIDKNGIIVNKNLSLDELNKFIADNKLKR
jgi:thiol-disulfide isomerase/thioredoxin